LKREVSAKGEGRASAVKERKTDEIVQEAEALTNNSHASSEFYSRPGPIILRSVVKLWKLDGYALVFASG